MIEQRTGNALVLVKLALELLEPSTAGHEALCLCHACEAVSFFREGWQHLGQLCRQQNMAPANGG